jgi:O-antigen ligase
MMVLSTRSLPITWAAFALLGWIGLALTGHARQAGSALRRSLEGHSVLVGLAGAFLLWASASVAWAALPARAAGSVGETVASLAAGVAAFAVVAAAGPRRAASLLLTGLVAAAALIVLELAFASPLRGLFTHDVEPFHLNRPTVMVVVLTWPAAFLLVDAQRVRAAVLLIAAAGVVALLSSSQSALLGWAAGIAAIALAMGSQRLTAGLVAVAGTIILLGMPFVPPVAFEAARASVAAAVPDAHIEDRLVIWEGFIDLRNTAPWHGFGLDASRAAPRLAEAAGLDADTIRHVDSSHPHSVSLQAWVELGLPGAALLAALTVAAALTCAGARPPQARFGLGLLASLTAIGAVSHGAWQGWWLALIVLAALLFAVESRRLNRPFGAPASSPEAAGAAPPP